jgi:GNAT superfamily N-acetyltransferase
MTAAISVRLARLEERQALEALQWRASLALEEYRDALLAHPDAIELPDFHLSDGHTLLDEWAGNTLGFAVVLPREDGEAQLDGLFVDPPAWRNGSGSLLVRESGILALGRGARALHVIANQLARGFYDSCGFVLMAEESTQFGNGLTMVQMIA